MLHVLFQYSDQYAHNTYKKYNIIRCESSEFSAHGIRFTPKSVRSEMSKRVRDAGASRSTREVFRLDAAVQL
jgi:hypothetical protein